MIIFGWQGKGFWIPIIVAVACFLPLIVLRQIEGPEVDHAVGVTMGIAGIVTLVVGPWLNRGKPKGEPSPHAFCRVPFQYWAVPMLVFAVLLGTRIITTVETPAGQVAAVVEWPGLGGDAIG